MTLRNDLQRYHVELLRAAADAESQRVRMIRGLDDQLAGLSRATTSVAAIENDVARLAAVADWALPSIVRQLGLTAERLYEVIEILANPRKTAGAELFRDGSKALAKGWVDEAVEDLTAAVTKARYHSTAWFNLGVGLQIQGADEKAAQAFASCARYSAEDSPVLAATAALIASSLYRRIGQAEVSARILRDFVSKLSNCAEIHLALAVHHGAVDHLRPALELAPGLAIDARAAGITAVERVAADLCRSEAGPVARLRALEQAMQAVARAAKSAGLQGIQDIPAAVSLPKPGVDALVLAEAGLPVVVAAGRRLGSEVNSLLTLLNTKVDRTKHLLGWTQEKINSYQGLKPDVALLREALDAFARWAGGSPGCYWTVGTGENLLMFSTETNRGRMILVIFHPQPGSIEVMVDVPAETPGALEVDGKYFLLIAERAQIDWSANRLLEHADEIRRQVDREQPPRIEETRRHRKFLVEGVPEAEKVVELAVVELRRATEIVATPLSHLSSLTHTIGASGVRLVPFAVRGHLALDK